ncbi:hypothetical protein F5X96DRAFT_616756 [Biscogniauxia mediterranea]|nr:hypothetical protein F5X96DRAFT_616756 [Biscogniauxia mediterranea]
MAEFKRRGRRNILFLLNLLMEREISLARSGSGERGVEGGPKFSESPSLAKQPESKNGGRVKGPNGAELMQCGGPVSAPLFRQLGWKAQLGRYLHRYWW